MYNYNINTIVFYVPSVLQPESPIIPGADDPVNCESVGGGRKDSNMLTVLYNCGSPDKRTMACLILWKE